MDPRTGEILEVANEAEAVARGLVPIPPEQLERIRTMDIAARKRWAATQQGLGVHPAAPAPDESPEDRQKARNLRKATRRARRAGK